MAQLIAKNKYSSLEQTDIKGWSIYHFAARHDRLEILQMFYENPDYYIQYTQDLKKNYPLQIASKYGKYKIVEYLIKEKVDKNINHQNSRGLTAYHYAAQCGQLEVMKLLDNKSCLNQLFNKLGQNALHIACYNGRSDCVEYLIKTMNFDPNILLKSAT